MSISYDVADQAQQCLINIEQALIEAGCTLKNVVRVTYILPNKYDFEACWPVFNRYFSDVKPAATMFEAGLLDDNMKIEIQVTARLTSTC